MYRNAFGQLVEWKNKIDRKPLIINGARQVGKTWLLKKFGQEQFANYIYLNFESNQRLKTLFDHDLNTSRIIQALEIETGKTITAGTTLIIFDEIQEAPKALTSLKYFQENAPEYFVAAAGSLLGVAFHQDTSFPVGKVDFLDLYPLSFPEFLIACNQQKLTDLLHEKDWVLIKGFREKYTALLKEYYFIGGMPEAVQAFITGTRLTEVRSIQKNILSSYEQDFSKHAPNEIVPRIRMLWNSVPGQLSKENRKFMYRNIKEGARAREFEMAMAWLLNSGLLHKINRITKPAIPLKAYEDVAAFKIYLCDVGLLGAMADLSERTILEGNTLFQEFKGALTEQFVLQQLVTHKNWNLYYWSAENARAELDFVVQAGERILALEIKAEENLKSKSLGIFHDKFQDTKAIRSSLSDYRQQDWMTNLPLYAIHELDTLL